MKDWLILISEGAIMLIDALALVIVLIGTIEVFIKGLHLMLSSPDGHERRDVWLRYARWLVAALTFQLAADIVESSIRTDWKGIAQLSAIAVIRTFLNYFLERDLAETRERQRAVRDSTRA
ncbi:MAG TPA: DUF1622 domain-containing protein [Steroidobacteraceae bacterium]|jgi:uncharacterized membrane protein